MNNFLNQPFHLLDSKRNRWKLVIVVGLFGIFFMNAYVPFNISRWYEKREIPLVLILSSFGLIGMIVLSISQFYIRDLFKIKSLKMYGVILWFMVELFLLTLTMYLIYGNRNAEGTALILELFTTFRYTLLITIIPYTGVLLLLTATQKNIKVIAPLALDNSLIKILDENDEVHIAIDLDQILYLKSADNYVAIYYQKDSKVKRELVRTTMRKLDVDLKDFPIRRCHRSYMVNLKKISVSEKSQQGLTLSLKDYPIEGIPVSKNYKSFFMNLLNGKGNYSQSNGDKSFIPNEDFLSQKKP
ncbi:MAG: LytR/AlgR family response regulator transcription factor [Bacteroidota bacterium]